MKYNGNDSLFRFRAPLLIAEAMPQEATLLRSTLDIVFPRRAQDGIEAFYGNFHCTQLDDDTALITDAALFERKFDDGSFVASSNVMAAIASH